LDWEIGGTAEAHCDNTDFCSGDPDYPQSREVATQALRKSVDHIRKRVSQGVSEALGLLDQKGFIDNKKANVGIFGCDFRDDSEDNAKCRSLQGFGRALDGIQDFYSHSNWEDLAAPPFSAEYPPGLAKSQLARFLNLRSAADINASIKIELTTGCCDDSGLWKGTTADKIPGIGFCAGQVMQHSITIDKCSSDPISGQPPRQRMYVVNCLMASTFAMQLGSRSKIDGISGGTSATPCTRRTLICTQAAWFVL
jgi:hypothetical protein